MGNYAILLPIFIPLVAAILVYVVSRYSDAVGSLATLFACFATTAATIYIYPLLADGKALTLKIDIGMPFSLFFSADALGFYLSLISGVLWTLAALYSLEYLEHRLTLFNVFLLLSLYGMIGIAFTGNLFSLLLFFELFSVASAVLVMHEGTREAVRAGFQYLFMSIVGSVAIIFATAAVYATTGSIDLVGTGLHGLAGNPMATALFWLLIAGFAIKAGMFPVHVWLPEAHPIAPSSASALLSGVMIKAGAYGVLRIVYGVYGLKVVSAGSMSDVLLVLAVITMILGSILAILQVELKRMLAYSSVAQIGYIMLGIALLTPSGLEGSMLHILGHALMKGSLFLAAGAVIHKTGRRKLEDLRGLGKVMPWTMATITLAALSMIGVPPFIGFFSKWLLAVGVLQAKSADTLAPWAAYTVLGALVLSGLLNIVYYGPIIIRGWFSEPDVELATGLSAPAHAFDGGEPEDDHGHGHGEKPKMQYRRMEPSWMMLVPLVSLGIGTLVFGIYVNLPMVLVKNVVSLYF